MLVSFLTVTLYYATYICNRISFSLSFIDSVTNINFSCSVLFLLRLFSILPVPIFPTSLIALHFTSLHYQTILHDITKTAATLLYFFNNTDETHAFLRTVLARMYDDDVAQETRIQYGGSVTPDSVDELMCGT